MAEAVLLKRHRASVLDSDEEPMNIADYTARGQMRKHFASANSVAFLAEITSNTTLMISLTAAQTANLVPGRYVYDVEIVSVANLVSRVLEGICTVRLEVTK